MKILLFGATGMVGQGVLRECLPDSRIAAVSTIGRSATGLMHPKLSEVIHPDLLNFAPIEPGLTGFDACFFCLGVTSAGLSETEYQRLTYGIATEAARTLCRLNPHMTFIYVSGAGTDSTEKGPVMWARIKGRTENTILGLPFHAAYKFRPGVIQPMHGERSKVTAYRLLYAFTKPLLPLLRSLFPRQILTPEDMGRAMIQAAARGFPKKILEAPDIKEVCEELVISDSFR